MKHVEVETTAEAYIELLAARGVDYFFGNGGTDFAPIVDAYAKRMEQKLPVPIPVVVPHEITAVAMASGYTMVTQRPQVVMVHTVPGTANAIGGLINARSANIPILFSAGRTPITEKGMTGSRNGMVSWAQESRDQGAMLREWTKWDYELRLGVDLEGVVDRALAISQSEPRGPVYLMLPREVMAQARGPFEYSEQPRMQPSVSTASPDAIQQAARVLARARNPMALTAAVGRDPEAVPELVALAETLGMGVFSSGVYMNFPVPHPLFQGETARAPLAEADVVLVLEQDAPWLPSVVAGPSPDATVIGLGTDPLFTNEPLRSFPVHVNLAGLPRHTLRALNETLKQERIDQAVIEERRERWALSHEAFREQARRRWEVGRTRTPLDRAWVSHCIEQFRTDDTTMVIEHAMDSSQFEFTRTEQFYRVPGAGVLGWAVGAALGAKLARPERTVIACMGDGSYLFGVPVAGHWASRSLHLPVLYVVWNNARWGSVNSATTDLYPNGWAAKKGFEFSDLSPSLDFEEVCRAAGGYAERVEHPEDVVGAIERGLHAVQVERRQALLNFIGV